MTTFWRDRLYRLSGTATVAVSTALFASPFIAFALLLIEHAYAGG